MSEAEAIENAKTKATRVLILCWVAACVVVAGVPLFFDVWQLLMVVPISGIGVALIIKKINRDADDAQTATG